MTKKQEIIKELNLISSRKNAVSDDDLKYIFIHSNLPIVPQLNDYISIRIVTTKIIDINYAEIYNLPKIKQYFYENEFKIKDLYKHLEIFDDNLEINKTLLERFEYKNRIVDKQEFPLENFIKKEYFK